MGAAGAAAGLAGAGGLYSAFQQGEAGKAQRAYYGYLADTSKMNAGLAEAQGEAAVSQIGEREKFQEMALSRRVSETIGAQKAAVVGGVGASSRTAQDIISDTMDKGSLDEMAIRYNAEIESRNARIGAAMGALNYRTQGAGYGIAGQNAMAAARAGQISTILGTAGSVANSWYMGNLYANRMGGY